MKKSFFEKYSIILIGFAAIFLWTIVATFGLRRFVYDTPFGIENTQIGEFFFAIIFAPLWEELAFRHAPQLIFKKIGDAIDQDFTWPVVILSSAIFGWVHGIGAISVLIQGVHGLILSFVYLKTGRNYWASVATHALWNLTSIYFIPFLIS